MCSTALMMRSLTVFGVLITFGNAASPLADFPASLAKGIFMKYKIMPSEFASSPSNKNQVSFNFSTECDYPELPSWLHLEQRKASAPAFFYGSPGNWDKSTKLEIIGWDKDSYATERIIQDVIISDGKGFPWFQAEFFIKNKTLDKFLNDGEDVKIVGIAGNYWSASDLGLTMVVSAIGRGGRVPLPDSNDHEGVIVRVGSSEMWPDNGTLRVGEEPSNDYFKDEGFEIDWSRFTWIDLRTMKDPEAERQALLPPDRIVKEVSYSPPEFDDSARDFDMDFILVIIIPIVIILIFVLILSLIMCLGREGRRKRDQQTPHIKLTHHHNIQRSTLRLRELSKPREQDQSPKSSPSENPTRPRHTHGEYERLDDDGDDDRTDGRNAPPPYRMPPGSAGRGAAQQV